VAKINSLKQQVAKVNDLEERLNAVLQQVNAKNELVAQRWVNDTGCLLAGRPSPLYFRASVAAPAAGSSHSDGAGRHPDIFEWAVSKAQRTLFATQKPTAVTGRNINRARTRENDRGS
jgi:hypothetical protein